MTLDATLRFTKHHGAGNDFLVLLDLSERRPLTDAETAALCDRHRGVGADGVLRAVPGAGGADIGMELRNADGGEAAMSGNGIRCLVQAAVVAGVVTEGAVTVSTPAGTRVVDYRSHGSPAQGHAGVDMGPVRLGDDLDLGDLANRAASGVAGDAPAARDLATALGAVRRACTADVGNPHLVLWGERGGAAQVLAAGPILQHAVAGGANVEFVWDGPGEGELTMEVWERGVGATLACGTGTCAAAAAARRWGRAADTVTIHNPGGPLTVSFDGCSARLSGPTQLVARVEVAESVLAALVAGRSARR